MMNKKPFSFSGITVFFLLALHATVSCAIVSVTVTDDRNKPVSEVRLALKGLDTGTSHLSMTRITDSEGLAFFRELTQGVYSLEASKQGYTIVAEPVVLHSDSKKVTVSLVPIEVKKVVNDFLARILKGRIFDSSRKPVAGVTVKMGNRSTVTGRDGRYTFRNIFEGSVTVSAEGEGYEKQSRKVILSRRKNYTDFFLSQKQFSLDIRGVVSDTDTEEPVKARVNFHGFSELCSDDGTYSLHFDSVPAAGMLIAEAPEYATYTTHISPPEKGGIIALEILLERNIRPVTISGTVLDEESGEPLIGAKVIIGSRIGYTGIEGEYRIEDIAMAEHEMLIFYRQLNIYAQTIKIDRREMQLDVLVQSVPEDPEE